MKIIFGLGNPGIKYSRNYHNLGYMAVDLLADKLNIKFDKKARQGEYAETRINGEKAIIVKPVTYMNNSGECVLPFVNFYKCDISDILVIYDDIDIDKGQLRFRPHGSAGTHNGMRSIVKCLGSTEFKRLRVGSKNTSSVPLIDYVLMNITPDDQILIKPSIERASECALAFLEGKTDDQLMAQFNRNES